MPAPEKKQWDHYEVLGVERAVTAAQLRKAYRKLVLQFHPDRNPDNPDAKEMFLRVSEAYEVLSDPQRRARYLSEIEAEEEPEPTSTKTEPERSPRRARRPRDQSPPPEPYDMQANELEVVDFRRGTLAGALFSVLVGTVTLQRQPWSLFSLTGKSLFPLVTGWIGGRIGAFAFRMLSSDSNPIVEFSVEGMGRQILPFLGTVIGLWAGFVSLAHWYDVDSFTGGIVYGALASGPAAAFGAAFGRAFTSVSKNIYGITLGLTIALVSGGIAGGIIGVLLPAFGLAFSFDTPLTHPVPLTEVPATFNTLFSGGFGGVLGGAFASLPGALRSLEKEKR